MKKIIFLVLLVLSSMLLMIGCKSNQVTTTVNNNDKIKQRNIGNSDENNVQLNLYFDASKDDSKLEIGQEERILIKEEMLGQIIVQELIKGPTMDSSLKPILSKDTKVLSFSINDGTAYVNLSNEAKANMSKVKEEAYLKSLALSLCELESIVNVKILIQNKDVDTLGGNYNVSKPFCADTIKLIEEESTDNIEDAEEKKE
ncbi:GerMN domain-containing protein [Clostridium sediminicola]|uniref:GerMN domain-containing protein n=1 Tax=Clostridium sediminicola TaxID=3114879 RepID=UPI0031F27AEE